MSSIANQISLKGLGELITSGEVTTTKSAQKIYTATKKCRVFLYLPGGSFACRINGTAQAPGYNTDNFGVDNQNCTVVKNISTITDYNYQSYGGRTPCGMSVDINNGDYLSVYNLNAYKYYVYELV